MATSETDAGVRETEEETGAMDVKDRGGPLVCQ